jgi:hypothetical protein
MIALQTASVSAFTSNGRNFDILDPMVVQQNFSNIQTEFYQTEERHNKLDKRMTELESFTHWVARNHPHVIYEYVVSNAAKEKIGVKKI